MDRDLRVSLRGKRLVDVERLLRNEHRKTQEEERCGRRLDRLACADSQHATRFNLPACPNCGRPGAHFCPPAFGDAGFFACEYF